MVMIGTKNICTFVYDMCKDSYLSLDKYVHLPRTDISDAFFSGECSPSHDASGFRRESFSFPAPLTMVPGILATLYWQPNIF